MTAEASEQVRVSVVVPAHNDAGYVVECLSSLLAQTHTPWEIVLCDDASDDATVTVAADFLRRNAVRHRIVRHDGNVGCARNFNAGLQAAAGTHVAIVAADDYWYPEKLEREIAALNSSGCGWAYSRIELLWDDGPDAGRRTPFWGTAECQSGDLFAAILERRVSPRNILIRRDLLETLGWFDTAFGMYEDWDLKLRLAFEHDAVCVPQVGGVYRQHGQGISRSRADRQLREAGRVLRKNRLLIEARYGERTHDVIADAYRKLLPGDAARRDTPAWLHWPYLPNRLDRLGNGVWFCAGLTPEQRDRLRDALGHHPDIAVTRSPTLADAVTAVRGAIDALASDAPALATAVTRSFAHEHFRAVVRDHGRALLLDVDSADRIDPAHLQALFPGAGFIRAMAPGVVSAGALSTPVPTRYVKVSTIDDAFLNSLLGLFYGGVRTDRAAAFPGRARVDAAVLNDEGESLFADGCPDDASRCFLRALAVDPQCVPALNNLGVVAWHQGRANEAVRWLQRALTVDAFDLDANRNLCHMLAELDRSAEAREWLVAVTRHRPDDRELRALLEDLNAEETATPAGTSPKSGVCT